MSRNLQKALGLALTIAGILLILGSTVLSGALGLQAQLLLVIVGLMLTEMGVWGFASKFVSNERRFGGLRKEGDRMFVLIRQLNRAALARDHGEDDGTRFNGILKEMHDSVHRMSNLASVEDGVDLVKIREAAPQEKSVVDVA